MRKSWFSAIAVLLAVLLASCASSPPNLPGVSIVSISPAVALPGENVTISGSNIGSDASVAFDGVEAAIVSAAATEVVVTVPDGSWGYPQILVANDNSSTTVSGELFVGVEVGTADLTGAAIQEALDDLPQGGAARLGEGTYVLSGDLLIDNRSLYGSGEEESVVRADGYAFDFLVANENIVVVQDLTLVGDDFEFDDGRLNQSSISQSGGARPQHVHSSRKLVRSDEGVYDRALHSAGSALEIVGEAPERREPSMGTQSTGLTGDFVFRNVSIEEETEDGGYLYAYELTSGFEFSGLTATIYEFYLEYVAGLTVTDSDISGSYIYLGVDFNGPLIIVDSELTASDAIDLEIYEAGEGFISGSTFTAQNYFYFYEDYSGRVVVEDSNITVNDGYVEFYLYTGPLTIRTSSIEALDDGDAGTAGNIPYVDVAVDYAGLNIVDNELIHGDSYVELETYGYSTGSDAAGAARLLVSANAEISSGGGVYIFSDTSDVTVSGNALIESASDFSSYTYSGDLTMVDNTDVRVGGTFIVETANGTTTASNDVIFNGNDVTVDYGSNPGQMLVTSNYGSLEAIGNSVTFTGDEDAAVGLEAYLGDFGQGCTVSDNTLIAVNTLDDSAGDYNDVYVNCYGTSANTGTAVIDGNVMDGSTGENSYVGVYVEYMTATLTGNTFRASDSAYVDSFYSDVTVDATNTFAAALSPDWAEYGSTRLTALGAVGTPASLSVDGATFQGGGIMVDGGSSDEFSEVSLENSAVDLDNNKEFGLLVADGARLNASGNTFGVQGSPAGTALRIDASTDPVYLRISDNSFSDFAQAIYAGDAAGAANGIDAQINDNVFDFTIDGLGESAELVNVGDVIDAEDNVWGANTSAAVVYSYVSLAGDTVAQAGDIDVDPITQP